MALEPFYRTTYHKSPAQKLIEQWSAKEAGARESNIKRAKAIESIFDEIITRYGPGGTYGKSAEALLERQKVRDVGATAQRDISRGLYGIRPYGAEWEATVGAPARLSLEDIKMQRLSQAQLGKAGFMERIEEPYPDYGMLATLIGQMSQGGAGAAMAPAYGEMGGAGRSQPITSLPGRTGYKVPEPSPVYGTAPVPGGSGYAPGLPTEAYGPKFGGGEAAQTTGGWTKVGAPYAGPDGQQVQKWKEARTGRITKARVGRGPGTAGVSF